MIGNVGGAIKIAVIVAAVLVITLFCVALIIMIAGNIEAESILLLIIAFAALLLLLMLLYGFGQLIENTDNIARILKKNDILIASSKVTDIENEDEE